MNPAYYKNVEALARAASEKLPEAIVERDPTEMWTYASDWTKLAGKPGVVFLPRTTEEVSAVLKLCDEMNAPVVPSGGRTGLAGGAVPVAGEAVLSLSRLKRIDPVDSLGLTVRVQAGAITQTVHQHCQKAGLTWPIDLAAKGSSQIGGNLSTNAGGLRVIRYGMARRWVTGLQVVTMNGSVIELNQGLEKNNTGFDLIQLIVGSEGTLAVITEATLKLARLDTDTRVFLLGVESFAQAEALFLEARRGPFQIVALEFLTRACARTVHEQLGHKANFATEPALYLVLEVEALPGKPLDGPLGDWLEAVMAKNILSEGMMAQSPREAAECWKLREGITESLQKKNRVKKFDVAVAPHRMAEFLSTVEGWFATQKFCFDLYLFGHWGDGSPHLNLVKKAEASDDAFQRDYLELEKWVFATLLRFKGSVSAEHGVGALKKHWLTFSRSPEELRIFRAIKAAFDPKGLLNPGKVMDLP